MTETEQECNVDRRRQFCPTGTGIHVMGGECGVFWDFAKSADSITHTPDGFDQGGLGRVEFDVFA